MLQELIDTIKPTKVLSQDFKLWKAHPITKALFADVQLALLEDAIVPLPADPLQADTLRERREGAKAMLLSLDGWSPIILDDEDLPNDND